MEERKKKEIEYYDNQAKKELKEGEFKGDFEGFDPTILSSYSFCYQLLEKHCKNKKILDYGCGNGVHSIFLAKLGKKVVGIDLSEKAISLAKKKVKENNLEEKTDFLVMDCEKLEFPDNHFDVIFDGGTFSSLDLDKALPELARVLKKDGILIGIETLGHNPLTNLKRKVNKKVGKRTEWAVDHIMKMEDFDKASNYFQEIEDYYFHLISWVNFPFLGFPGFVYLFKVLEAIERFLLKFSFLKKYSFKTVFVFSNPKK
jgi:ubiquinone/menaquinone biosynthesis C-methylase UbiE